MPTEGEILLYTLDPILGLYKNVLEKRSVNINNGDNLSALKAEALHLVVLVFSL